MSELTVKSRSIFDSVGLSGEHVDNELMKVIFAFSGENTQNNRTISFVALNYADIDADLNGICDQVEIFMHDIVNKLKPC